jgi:prolyl 4-hydroxylase
MSIQVPMRFPDTPLLWTMEDVYSPAECTQMIGRIEQAAPTIATNNPLYRNQDRVIFDDPEQSKELFERLKEGLPQQIGPLHLLKINERLRCYRYRPQQQFLPHMDHWYRPNDHQITLLSVLVYLNGNFQGGETRFMEQIERLVIPKPGLVAIFQHKIRHEGCTVIQGTKYAMRTDVIYGDQTD